MNRLFLMLVLIFTTVTFFSNEKTEVLPDFRCFTDVESMDLKLTTYQANPLISFKSQLKNILHCRSGKS